jgi:Smg protein
MKEETILDVLLFLFENYIYDDPDVVRDRDSLQKNMLQAGFSPTEINKAFDWLEELSRERPINPAQRHDSSLRLFAEAELQRLDTESRGFLMFLEQHGVLDANQRELVLDRAMALDQEEVDLDDLKWVVLMVLFNQPGSEAAFAWMESQMFGDEPEPIH